MPKKVGFHYDTFSVEYHESKPALYVGMEKKRAKQIKLDAKLIADMEAFPMLNVDKIKALFDTVEI